MPVKSAKYTKKSGEEMKVALTIAGSDSGGGAGIQADLKTFEAHGVFGTSAITVLTSQNTKGVTDISQLPPEFVASQIKTVFDDFDVAAVKIGMLFSKDIIKAVREALVGFKKPVVLDPVFVSRANSLLLRMDAVEELRGLFEIATIVTPNMFEAHNLFGYTVGDSGSIANVTAAPCPVLIKNHPTQLDGKEYSVDVLYSKEGKQIFQTPMSKSTSTHGTGCSFSAAVAANLALGYDLLNSIERAKTFVYYAIESAPHLGGGNGPIGHLEGYKKMLNHYGEES